MSKMHIGTCSWKYDSWKEIVYPETNDINFLKEYSKHFDTVEIDQWFWSLFDNKVVLPDSKTVKEYKNSVPSDFKFTIKVPNSITLTHPYSSNKNVLPAPNKNFLSAELFETFLQKLKPIEKQIGCLMLQFEYMNKQKMPSLHIFQNKLFDFINELPKSIPPIAVEIRNPNYLTENYFKFLYDLNIYHVFLEGYFMPSIHSVFENNKDYIKKLTVIRLHGPDRSGIEKISNKIWNKIYINRDDNLQMIIQLINELMTQEVDIYLNVNNHFEGSAPLTINKIKNLLDKQKVNLNLNTKDN